ncbi:hypothetical protein NX801_14160 [Streptomyces sp. LP05-1]|uniref:Uncharacterized protein n=1 Tax=Streptomyces pyxinae TaxID=2970734 RepID=A0ABT2CHB5_9ACTN|nr:hypothetical protein [Streptomyces sp. LP05-1]MCS0636783.1 hypothetical protein [Streptomyces sp. LP05-1]
MGVDFGHEQDVLIGTRPRARVEDAYRRLEREGDIPGRPAHFSAGALEAYGWALGRSPKAPVTGAVCLDGTPSSQLLTAELDAAVVRLDDPTEAVGPRAEAAGAHDALAWLCGLIEERP